METLADQRQGRRGLPQQAGATAAFSLVPLPLPAPGEQLGRLRRAGCGGGERHWLILLWVEVQPLQGQLAQGLSFSISPMKTNRSLYCSAWPLGPLKAGAYLQTSCKSLLSALAPGQKIASDEFRASSQWHNQQAKRNRCLSQCLAEHLP